MSRLSEAARLEYHLQIGESLPRSVEPTDAHRASRLASAIEAFNDLRPGNAYEALLAVQIVVCAAHALDCLHDASQYSDDFSKAGSSRKQAASMMREARAAKRILSQEQKQRLAIETVAVTHQVRPAAPGPAQPTALPCPGAEPLQAPAPDHQPVPPPHLVATAETTLQPSPEAIAGAEAFTIANILAAAQIREDRGVTPQNQALFHGVLLPIDPAVMDALVRGRSPILDALDGLNQEMLDAAA